MRRWGDWSSASSHGVAMSSSTSRIRKPASLAPYGLNALTAWLAVIVGCTCLALVFAALARRFPQADGPFDYLRTTLGEPVAFATMWCYWISTVVTLPALYLAGRRLGGRAGAWTALLLLATLPFALRYATEARMYSASTQASLPEAVRPR